jgi:SOS-response transcriptional repressor LexA
MDIVGRNIRKLRHGKGLLQKELAVRAQMDPSNLSKLERGEYTWTSESLEKVAAALEVHIGELFITEANATPSPVGTGRIPVLDYVQAGAFTGVNHNFGDEEMQEFVFTELHHSPHSFAMKLRGDSMEPRFSEGDLIVIDPALTPRPGDFVLATDESGSATYKQFRDAGLNEQGRDVFELVPLNSLYASMRSDRQPITIKGVMVEHRRYRKR